MAEYALMKLQPLLGLTLIIGLAWLLSEDRRAVRPRLVSCHSRLAVPVRRGSAFIAASARAMSSPSLANATKSNFMPVTSS
jgi:nucleoside permease NupC